MYKTNYYFHCDLKKRYTFILQSALKCVYNIFFQYPVSHIRCINRVVQSKVHRRHYYIYHFLLLATLRVSISILANSYYYKYILHITNLRHDPSLQASKPASSEVGCP